MRNKLSLMNTVYWNNMRTGEDGNCEALQLEGHLTSRQSFWALIITRLVLSCISLPIISLIGVLGAVRSQMHFWCI